MASKNRTVDMAGLTINVGAVNPSGRDYVAAGATKTLTAADDGGKIVRLDTAGGSVVTLPAATGSGVEYTFVVTTLATSASHKIQVANGSDIFVGTMTTIDTDSSDAVAIFGTTSTSDTYTLNRSTMGSVRLGETIFVKDVAANRWYIDGIVCVTGVPATGFSAAV